MTNTAICDRCGFTVELVEYRFETHHDAERTWRETEREGTCGCGAAVTVGCTWEVRRHD
jgi:hypothetical protein